MGSSTPQPPVAPPAFGSPGAYVSSLDDVAFWSPYLSAILRRGTESDPIAGYNPTWPTFLCGDVVVKLFGYHATWRETFEAEARALTLVSTDPEVVSPRVLGEGWMFEDAWPYLVTSRIPGAAAWPDEPTDAERPSIARELGRQVRRIHALDPSGIATDEAWPDLDIVGAAERSSLSPHLVAQVDDYVARLGPFDRVFVHGDLVAQHVFVEDGRLTGIIDWADAIVTDRHYELAQLFRDTFACDKDLFRVFLEAADWPVTSDFPTRTLGHALRRQAMMLAQHPSGDVFEPIAERFPLDDIRTLDELAETLFSF